MNRHAKKLQTKQKKHQVRWPHGVGNFPAVVVSGTSGTSYTVSETTNGSLRCTCKWAKYNPNKPCTHTLACHQDLESRRETRPGILSFWANEAGAERQHRPMTRLSNGLWATSRKAA